MGAETKSETVLDRIIEARRAAIAHRKKSVPETALRFGVKHAKPVRDFAAALTRDSLNVIAELKKASPSRGLIRADLIRWRWRRLSRRPERRRCPCSPKRNSFKAI